MAQGTGIPSIQHPTQNPLNQKLFAGLIFLVRPHQECTEEVEQLIQLRMMAQLIQVSAFKVYQKGKQGVIILQKSLKSFRYGGYPQGAC